MGRFSQDVGRMVKTISGLPGATRRALVIVCTGFFVIGFLVFWPDVVSAVGLGLVGSLFLLALVALTTAGVESEPFVQSDDDDDDSYGI